MREEGESGAGRVLFFIFSCWDEGKICRLLTWLRQSPAIGSGSRRAARNRGAAAGAALSPARAPGPCADCTIAPEAGGARPPGEGRERGRNHPAPGSAALGIAPTGRIRGRPQSPRERPVPLAREAVSRAREGEGQSPAPGRARGR